MTTPVDVYGKPLMRALFREGCKPESVDALRMLIAAEGAEVTVEEVAREIGVRLPEAPVPRLRRRRIHGKRR